MKYFLRYIVVIVAIQLCVRMHSLCQCPGGVYWSNGANALGSLRDTATVLINDTAYLNTTTPTFSSFNAGRPGYYTNGGTITWAGHNFQSIGLFRGGGSGAATHFVFKIPLDSNFIHFRVYDIRGDGFNGEHQRVVGYRKNVKIAATFKELVNGASISGDNVNGGGSTTSTIQSGARAFFNEAVDSVVISSVSFSDFVRIELHARCDIVLANENIRLQATRQNSSILLFWNSFFNSSVVTIERSFDGIFWEKQNTIRADELRYVDNHPLPGVNYYRISITNNINRIIYSNIVTVAFNESINKHSLYTFPNPFKEELHFKAIRKGYFELLNAQGTVVKLAYHQALPGAINSINTSQLPLGVYFVRITAEDGTVTKQKVLKL